MLSCRLGRGRWMFNLAALLMLALGPGMAGVAAASEGQAAPEAPLTVPASHRGEAHEELLLEGASGACPQERKTPDAPTEYLRMQNPLQLNEENLKAGETLFKVDARPTPCLVCHGFKGNGMGIIYDQLEPKPRNFTCYYTMSELADGQLFWIIKNGSPGTRMPAFGVLSDEQVWQLILYIRQFAH